MMAGHHFLRRLFLIRKCVACKKLLEYDSFDEVFCPECRLAYQVAKTESCTECYKSAADCSCMPKRMSDAGALCHRKLFFYQASKEREPQNKLIYFLKHQPNKRAEGFVARELLPRIARELDAFEIQNISDEVIVTGVPRGRKAVIKYGFDQSERIGKAIGDAIGAPYASIIKRHRGGSEQKRLSASERQRNMSGLFYTEESISQIAKGKVVVLFDDVVTTGSSMAAAVKLLRRQKPRGVICVSLAADKPSEKKDKKTKKNKRR